MSAHPRVSVSGLCFPELSALDTLEAVAALGVTNASLTGAKVRAAGAEAVAAASRRHGVRVVTTTAALGLDLRPGAGADAVAAQLREARVDVDNAAAVGAGTVYGLTGPRPGADWDAGAAAYADAVTELVDHAAGRGVTLAVEPANWLYADLTFVHTFHDALRLARRAGVGVCLDLFHVWTEGGLRAEIAANADAVVHVQLSDMVLGDRTLPCRAVPGDGDVPLASLVGWLLEAGYQGVFDCELSGPRIDALGTRTAAARSAAWLTGLLTDLGA